MLCGAIWIIDPKIYLFYEVHNYKKFNIQGIGFLFKRKEKSMCVLIILWNN